MVINKVPNKVSLLIFPVLFILILALFPALTLSSPQLAQDESLIFNRNTQVEDQQKHSLNFFLDLIKKKSVAINFIFTSCTSSCSLSSAIFRQVQKKLGKQKIQLISITVDPVNDTPERLLEFSKRFNAAPGWAFITGEKNNIAQLLKNFGVFTTDRNSHSNVVIVGNDSKRQWVRLYGFPQANEIIATLKDVAGETKNN